MRSPHKNVTKPALLFVGSVDVPTGPYDPRQKAEPESVLHQNNKYSPFFGLRIGGSRGVSKHMHILTLNGDVFRARKHLARLT